MSEKTWHETESVAIEIEDTEVGRELSLYEWSRGEWKRRYTMPAGTGRDYYELMKEVFPDD